MIPEKTAVNCRTRKEARKILALFDKMGVERINGEPCASLKNIQAYAAETCYTPKGYRGAFEYGYTSSYQEDGYTILTADEFLQKYKPNPYQSICREIYDQMKEGNPAIISKETIYGKKLIELFETTTK